jgi:cytoplasmic iron level regulating protein YaaA (DUF328/UPF0246 family)
MELILIACSKGKLPGGECGYQNSKRLTDALGAATYNRLLELRHELVSLCEKPLPKGTDLGFTGYEATAEYMPAYQRYNGKIYQYGRVKELYPCNRNIHLIIISAMYGFLDAGDLIQNYDLKMDDKVSGTCIFTWWKNQKLGKILEKYILSLDPVTVHDILPAKYRKALEPWPPTSLQGRAKPYDYPGQRTGSIWRRAEDLEKLLLT